MEKVSDTCRTHCAIVSKVCNCRVGYELQLIRPIVSKVLCSWNQVYKLSASLHKKNCIFHSFPCLWWTHLDLRHELALAGLNTAQMRHHAEQSKLLEMIVRSRN